MVFFVSLLVDESLPNITGTLRSDGEDKFSGAFYKAGRITGDGIAWVTTSGSDVLIGFDASRSSSTYKNNAHVRPLSMTTAFLIKY